MRTLPIEHATLTRITVVGGWEDPAEDNVDIWVDLRDGRRFGFTVFTIGSVQRLMSGRRSFVSPGMLLVSSLTAEAIVEAVVEAAHLGIENFGILQTDAHDV